MHRSKMIERAEGPHALPPLTALRSFEAAARHGSFTRAAEELFVTQTAISHQVRQLEGHLGISLFTRLARRIVLTPDGRAWAEALGDVFGRLNAANRRLRRTAPPRRPMISVSILPSFASRWLVPRLGRFLDQHADVDVRISPAAELVDLGAEGFDFGVRYGHGRYPGLRVDKLHEDAWLLVSSPALRGRSALRTAHDLRRFPLIHDDEPDAFNAWMSARGIRNSDTARATMLADSSMVVEAAVRGQGIALVRRSLAIDELIAGRLVRLFPRIPPMPTGRSYYLVSPRSRAPRPEVAAFREWILAEAKIAFQSL